MKLLEYFAQFLTDKVNLNESRLGDLDSRVASITETLKESSSLDGRILDTIPQGSWPHKTIIRPAFGLEFDADFLVQLAEDYTWNLNPQKYNDAVWDALNGHGTYAVRSTRKNRCVRVRYANLCHIDLVPYVVMANDAQVIVNRTSNTFEDTNPVGFTEWLQEKDDLTNSNLRKVIRLLKYLRDQRSAFSIKSVLLTTLVGNVVDSWRALDAEHYKDVPTTLVHLLEELDAWLQIRPSKPSITDPSCPSTSFDHRWTDNQYATFRDAIHKLTPRVRSAYDTEGSKASVAAWRVVFGDSFPNSLAPKAVSVSSLAKSVFPHAGRSPREQFIDEMFRVDLTCRLAITCEVSEAAGLSRALRRKALRSRGGRVVKQRELLFKVIGTDVAPPYRVFWKVRNEGQEAKRVGQLRGEITEDQGGREKTERTLYAGHHWVECYIVKDGVCVAKDREPVVIL